MWGLRGNCVPSWTEGSRCAGSWVRSLERMVALVAVSRGITRTQVGHGVRRVLAWASEKLQLVLSGGPALEVWGAVKEGRRGAGEESSRTRF